VLAQLASTADGLSTQEAAQRLSIQGPNELKEGHAASPFQIFLGQFKSLIIWVLIAAGVISGVLGETVDAIARERDAWLLSDEVYRGLGDDGDATIPAIVDLYEKGISTGSMSKVYSLAGLRLGWIAAPTALIRAVSIHRDYTTISVGMLDDFFAALALEHGNAILARSRRITRENRALLAAWMAHEPHMSWVAPQGGTTALLKYHFAMTSEDFCMQLLEQTGVLLIPGSAMDMEGYVRIGYTNREDILREGLARISAFLACRPGV
ncbi:MAG: aminotransferase class I/II-fold pyridoxal phosphate-dependent enzyme, partial [Oscillochloris sp.]|nr:aminotransferase class I/II-fold pyridoxal phosphate-dependent enzyme [Oscillochloris sp.]